MPNSNLKHKRLSGSQYEKINSKKRKKSAIGKPRNQVGYFKL